MVIGLFDYVSYRLQRGRYSARAIEAKRYTLASAKSYPSDKLPMPGHIIIVHTRGSFLSWLVMYFTNSVASHTAIAVDNGNIVEVTLGGTIEHPFSDCLNDKDYLVIGGPPLTVEQQRIIVEGARAAVGVSKFGYHIAARMGLNLLVGRGNSYNPRLSVDLLTVLFAVYWLNRHHKRIALSCVASSIIYIVMVLINRKHGRKIREARSEPGADGRTREQDVSGGRLPAYGAAAMSTSVADGVARRTQVSTT